VNGDEDWLTPDSGWGRFDDKVNVVIITFFPIAIVRRARRNKAESTTCSGNAHEICVDLAGDVDSDYM
jgi:hypothetical protein